MDILPDLKHYYYYYILPILPAVKAPMFIVNLYISPVPSQHHSKQKYRTVDSFTTLNELMQKIH